MAAPGIGSGDARTGRLAAAMRAELADMIAREIHDPRVHAAGLLTVTEVRLTPDKHRATVWVSILGGEVEAVRAAIVGLERAAGFLRGEVARRLGLRRAPELKFELDHTGDRFARIDEILAADRAAGHVGEEPAGHHEDEADAGDEAADPDRGGEGGDGA